MNKIFCLSVLLSIFSLLSIQFSFAQNQNKIEFATQSMDFGEVKEGAIVEKIFEFKNNNSNPLLILDVLTTCGCTATEWKKEPILPNEKSQIKVRFDSKGKIGRQHKSITLITNTQPERWVITLSGIVLPEK